MVSTKDKKRIAVTGYGSFGSYTVSGYGASNCNANPSSVVVKNLSNVIFPDNIELQTEIIPVAYDAANSCSTRICSELKPDFIVHIGVSGEWEDCIQLELQSFSHGYWSPDVDGKVPYMNCSKIELGNDRPKILKTVLDCQAITEKLSDSYPDLCIDTSDNPGRYLCAYIYYSSLAQYNGKALFIHVPPFNDSASTPEQITSAIVDIIKEVAKQL